MACLQKLKEDIRLLESIFPKSHDRFQIVNGTVDEICCRFVGPSGQKISIIANIMVGLNIYPGLFLIVFYFGRCNFSFTAEIA